MPHRSGSALREFGRDLQGSARKFVENCERSTADWDASMDFFRQIQLINEAYAIEHNLPVKRQFTAAELEQPIEQVREAAEQAKSLPLLLVEQTLAIRESAERLREGKRD